jgi:hypothetical protein
MRESAIPPGTSWKASVPALTVIEAIVVAEPVSTPTTEIGFANVTAVEFIGMPFDQFESLVHDPVPPPSVQVVAFCAKALEAIVVTTTSEPKKKFM